MINILVKIKQKLCFFILILTLCTQFYVWYNWTSKIKYNFKITPLPPSSIEMNTFALGDKTFLYRLYGFQLQNAGDTFGETMPLKDYDFEKLEKWFYALTELDDKSEYVPSIAGFYYSSSQNYSDNKYIVNYLVDFADKNPEKYWRWYATSAYLAKYKLKNEELAFNIAKKMLNINNQNMPFINRAMALFMLNEKDLHTCKVVLMVKNLIESGDLESILKDKYFSTKEGNYNMLFKLIKYRLDAVVQNKKLLKECVNHYNSK